MRTRVWGTRLPKEARSGAIRSSVSVWALTPASSSFISESASGAGRAGPGSFAAARAATSARNAAARRAASSGASARMPCMVTPSARANCRRTPGWAGSKPPRKPARPAPIRKVTDGAGSESRRACAARRRSASSRAGEGERVGDVGGDLPALLGGVRHRDEDADHGLGAVERGAEDPRGRQVLDPEAPLEREVEGLEEIGQVREGADVLAQGDEADAGDAGEKLRAARLRDPLAEERVDVLRGAVEEARDRLQVERPDLHDGADLGGGVHLGDGDLVDGVLLRHDPDPLAGEVEEHVRAGHGGEDLRDLLLVLLDERVGDAEEEVAVLAGDDAVPQEGEHDPLRDVEPVRADLPSLEVEQHLAAGAEEVGDRLLVLEPRLHQRVPLEVGQGEAGAVGRALGGRAQGAVELLGAVGGRVGVLRPGQPERLVARVLEEAPPRRGERLRLEAVEGVVALRRADALPDGVLRRPCPRRHRGGLAPESRPAIRRGRARAELALLRDAGADAVHEDRQLLDVLRAVGEALPRPEAGGALAARPRRRRRGSRRRRPRGAARRRPPSPSPRPSRGCRCGGDRTARPRGRGRRAGSRTSRRSRSARRRAGGARPRPAP